MTFNIALSGIQSASNELDIIGNNVANAGTTGFKKSRAEFSDVYAASALGTSTNAVGSGVKLASVTQQFNQGNVAFTGNNLDLAISGEGFFRLNDAEGSTSYTRSGAFSLDNQGFIVNNQGKRLMGNPADNSGNIQQTIAALQIDTTDVAPQGTTAVTAQVNLDANSSIPGVAFDPANPNSFNDSFSTTIFDSLGNSHVMTQYFRKTAANEWDVIVQVDGRNVGAGAPATVASFSQEFNSDGSFDAASSTAISITNWTPLDAAGNPNGADGPPATNFTVDISASTQFASGFVPQSVSQNGLTTGRLDNLTIEADGLIQARYTNGVSRALGQLSIAKFQNPNGLSPQGDSEWVETAASGTAVPGEPGKGSLGIIQSGALEESTVNLTEELVGMILAQRNFQANAQTIRTADAVTQTIINLR